MIPLKSLILNSMRYIEQITLFTIIFKSWLKSQEACQKFSVIKN